MPEISISLLEWQTLTPSSEPKLAGVSFGNDSNARHSAQTLTRMDRLEVLELRAGLSVSARSYVGSLKLGDVRITVHPKLTGAPLLNLLRYAYGLRQLVDRLADKDGCTEPFSGRTSEMRPGLSIQIKLTDY